MLAALGAGGGADPNDPCAGCLQSCAAQCATKVRTLMETGADRIEYHGEANDVPLDLARYIDHTLLKPDASAADIDKLCDEAAEHHFASVCVNPAWVRRAANRLRDTDVAVASVIGFPFGATPSDVKAFETRRAVRDGASDIHLEPFRAHSRIRFRIDGLLYEFTAPPAELHPALVSRLKVMANLDIAERRRPQDGRIKVTVGEKELDLRVSIIPTNHGQSTVMRILDKDNIKIGVRQLGLSEYNHKKFQALIKRPNGIILVTGPTGSGKAPLGQMLAERGLGGRHGHAGSHGPRMGEGDRAAGH